jgi:hypothetical protein
MNMKRLFCSLMLVAAAGAAMADDLGEAGARARHAADIAYWTTAYQGEDLVSGKHACPMPDIPDVSTSVDEIQKVGKAISRWSICYNDFASYISAAGPTSNRIPADIRKLMTPAELAQAIKRLDTVVTTIVERRGAEAELFMSRRNNWLAATDKYLSEGRAEVVKIFMENEYDYIRRPDTGYLAHRSGRPSPAYTGPASPTGVLPTTPGK